MKEYRGSLWITVYDQWEYTQRCIESIARNPPKDVFIGFISDNPGHDIGPLIRSNGWHYIHHRTTTGLTHSWNEALAFSQDIPGPVVISNDDVIFPSVNPECDWWGRLTAPLTGKVGISGPLTNQPGSQPKQQSGGDDWNKVETYNGMCQGETPFSVGHVNGFCFAMNPVMLQDVGRWFHPKNRLLHNEKEYQRRAKDKGWKFVCCGNLFVYHFKGVSRGCERFKGRELPRL